MIKFFKALFSPNGKDKASSKRGSLPKDALVFSPAFLRLLIDDVEATKPASKIKDAFEWVNIATETNPMTMGEVIPLMMQYRFKGHVDDMAGFYKESVQIIYRKAGRTLPCQFA